MEIKDLKEGDRFATKDKNGQAYTGTFLGLEGYMAKVRFDHIGYADYRWTLIRQDTEIEKE